MDLLVNSGIVKATANMIHLAFFDGQTSLPVNIRRAVLTAFTLQLVGVFDDGLAVAWLESRPGTTPPLLGVKVNQMAEWGMFLGPDDAKKVVQMRNKLAHEPDAHATGQDWQFASDVIKRELRHLGVIYNP